MATSPFPGMDPYVERYWNDVHGSLITYIKDALNEALPSRFRAALQDRVIIASVEDPLAGTRFPDVAVVEAPFASSAPTASRSPHGQVRAPELVRYKTEPLTQYSIEIVDSQSREKVITAIEVLSPENKRPGDGMRKFEEKQEDYRRAKVSRVNIDLLREGHRFFEFPARLLKPDQVKPYYVTIYRADKPGECEFYAIDLRDPLPIIGIPLRIEDRDVQLDLQSLIQHVYHTGRFPVDYDEPCDPPLKGEDATWARELLTRRQP